MNFTRSCVSKGDWILVATLCILAVTSGKALAQTTCTENPTTTVNTANGAWTLSPAVPTAYQTQVNPPIAADGSSVFPAKRGVIPVQFSLSTAPGPITFESIGSDGYYGYNIGTGSDYADDCSYLSFSLNQSITFSQLTNLSAGYVFTEGDCHGGSLRWSVETEAGTVLIYYGLPPEAGDGGTGGCTPNSAGGQNQSGTNMIGNAAIQYDTSKIPGGAYYDNYAGALSLIGNSPVTGISLNLESGWDVSGGDQKLTLESATVSTSLPTSDTFTPPTGPVSSTCTLPTAQIQVSLTSGANPGVVNDVLSVSSADSTGYFRVVDCKYIYNLDVSSLSGAGNYSVSAIINGSPAGNPATFTLK